MAKIRERVPLKFSAVSRTLRKKKGMIDLEMFGVIVMSLTALVLVAALPRVREAMLDTFDKIFDALKSLVGG